MDFTTRKQKLWQPQFKQDMMTSRWVESRGTTVTAQLTSYFTSVCGAKDGH